ncbi:galactokinase [Streptantibioticus silvisoli]|uniref:Galactokinase n=1 Tax=Streptantibioticus silvisoli TaxID=2705255 RepID=A0ABT6W9H7_9ACTN|nr:galactokinase [Streptantibioticus silvisoli]MDI5967403.1 galactokinase [Streptantibioticus silvisoli]
MTADVFQQTYGFTPEGVWAAPGRVNLIGEHTDYNDGFVLPFAIHQTTTAAVARRDDGLLRLHSSADPEGAVVELRVADLVPGGTDGWAAYPAGVVWALRDAGHPVTGADIHYDSTIPIAAGLSSSHALEVVTTLALSDLFGLDLPLWQLARLCQRAENVFVGAPTGIMDQTASACCVEGHALHLDTRDLSQRQIPLDLAAHGLRLLVFDTRVKHAHSEGGYGDRRRGCERAAAVLGVTALRDVPFGELDQALDRLRAEDAEGAQEAHDAQDAQRSQGTAGELTGLVRHIVTENHRVEQVVARLEAGDPRAIGPLLTAGHASLRDDFKVSCPELDLVVDTANAAGALGARMTGGGFGGSAIVLTDERTADHVTEAVLTAFATKSLTAPRVFTATPGAGARRLA